MATESKEEQKEIIKLIKRQEECPKGYNVDIFKHKSNALQYQCAICKQICKNPVELQCGEYDENDENESVSCDDGNSHDVLYCESCLSLYLSKNSNQCPINPKHLDMTYNIARNIRKQINSLLVYCNNKQVTTTPDIEGCTGCDWIGKLCKLSSHLKSCTFNKKITCNICETLCIENDILQHNKLNIIKHITLLHEKVMHKNNSQLLQEENQEISALKSENIKLKNSISCMNKEFNEWKISYSIESTKKELKFQKQLKKQTECIELLQKQHKCLQLHSDSQCIRQLDKLQHRNSSYKSHSIPARSRESVKLILNIDRKVPAMNKTRSAPMERSSSTRYFHALGVETYHSKTLHYEMYHPKECEEVWVSKTKGSMSKVYRYPCCGSAKEGAIYLLLAESENKWDEEMYVVGDKENLPKNWNDEIYLGCKKNKKKNAKNMSYYLCCDGSIVSIGCKKRYKCCKQDLKSNGCKVGWGC